MSAYTCASLLLSSVRREITQLDALGVLVRHAAGNRVYVQLKHCDPLARLLLSADVAMSLRGRRFDGMPANRGSKQLLIELCAHMPPMPASGVSMAMPNFLRALQCCSPGTGL